MALFLGFGGCGDPPPDKPDVIVLQTGRLRGNIYPLSLQNIAPLQHYQYLAGYVKGVREEARELGAEVVLVDLGDSLEGSFASYVTDSANVTEFFRFLAYDAVVLGNLDNELSLEVMSQLPPLRLNPFIGPQGQETYPGTSAAGILPPTGQRRTPIYLLANFYGDIEVENYPDRFPTSFGAASSGVSPVRSYGELVEGWSGRPEGALTLFAWLKFEAPSEPPREFLQELRSLEVDAILAQRVYGSRERDVWSEAEFPGWEPPVLQNILRNNGGFTVARMDLKREGSGWKVLQRKLVPMTANTAPESREVVELIERFAQPIREADQVVRELEAPVEEAAILWAVLRSLTALPGADAVVYSPQSVRASWTKGTLRASQLFNSLPWTTPLVSTRVSEDELRELARINGQMEFWWRDELPLSTEGIDLMASRYFLPIFERQIGRSMDYTVAAESDFTNFLTFLQNDPTALDLRLPPGWQRISPAPPPEEPGS